MFRLLGFAVLALFILGMVPLIIQLLAAVAVLLGVLALLAVSSMLVFRIVKAFTVPKPDQARQRPKERGRHQEGQNRRQSQERHEKNSRHQQEDTTQGQDRHQDNSRHQQNEQQWSNGQYAKADTHPRSFYEMLGIRSNVTRKEIDEAWRRIDYGQNLPIETRRAYFEAYSTLINPERRRQYDTKLERHRHENESKQYQGRKRRQERKTDERLNISRKVPGNKTGAGIPGPGKWRSHHLRELTMSC